jgi:DNA-3-methyladenine glycosylase
MGIRMEHNGILLQEGKIWFEKPTEKQPGMVYATKRIGIDYAGEDALLPYRFVLLTENKQIELSDKNNQFR